MRAGWAFTRNVNSVQDPEGMGREVNFPIYRNEPAKGLREEK